MSNIANRLANLLSASGAIAFASGLFHITKPGTGAFTLAAPDADGYQMTLIDETGHAHTIVVTAVGSPPTAGLNGGGVTTVTFNGTKGSAVELVSRAGSWWTGPLSGVALS